MLPKSYTVWHYIYVIQMYIILAIILLHINYYNIFKFLFVYSIKKILFDIFFNGLNSLIISIEVLE